MLEKMVEKLDEEAIIEEFEVLSRDAGRVQRETLKKILEENGEAEYLQGCGLGGRMDAESYAAHVPIVGHKDLEPYIQKIVDGVNPFALTGKPIHTISLSSGTTQGKPKFVPFNDELMETTMLMLKTSFAFRNREYPIGNGKALQFIYSSKEFKTRGGLSAGTATTNVYRNAGFKKTMKATQTPCCSPDEVIFGPDFHQSLYCHFLSGLIHSEEIQVISSTFAHSIVHAFRTFEQDWEQLVNDIQEGTLSNRITVPSIRAAMAKVMKPNHKLADEIYRKCKGVRYWYGIIPALFPNARYVYAIMTGSMEPYVKKLRHYAGKLPLVSADYGASEGWIGVNMNPKLPPEFVTFVVRPDIGYFEFIPLHEIRNGCQPQPVGLTDVIVGQEYEVVVTNVGGLYRYRMGDIVRVKGFHYTVPELQFVCRKDLLLTINIDKNTEKDLQLAVESMAQLLAEEKLEVVDFTSRVDLSTDPGHYIIFLETTGNPGDELLQECCNCLDGSFVDAGYVSSRKVNSIGALELRTVKSGTFKKILDHYVGMGSAANQFKTPRCVGPTNTAVLQLLNGNCGKRFLSHAFN